MLLVDLTVIGALGLLGAPPPANCYPPPRASLSAREHIGAKRWRLYALQYAQSEPIEARRMVRRAPKSELVPVSWHFYLAVGHERVVMIDAGTDHFARNGPYTKRWSIARARTIPQTLAQIGLGPEDVTDVVLTHSHWDHVGGIKHLTKARLHALRGTWRSLDKRRRESFESRRAALPVEETPATLLEGLLLLEAGRHTSHHAVVELACPQGPVILAGDGAYLWSNLERRVAITGTDEPARNVREMQALVERVGVRNVIPGHDPMLFERFPSGQDGVALICP